MYKCKYFAQSLDDLAQQLLPKDVYKKGKYQALSLMDSRIIESLDNLRYHLKCPLTVNNWTWGGDRNQSGFRSVDFYESDDHYISSNSQHKYGRAVDFINRKMSAHEVRKFILENKELFPHIKFLEVGPLKDGSEMSWVHIDCRSTDPWLDNDTIICWSPKLGYVTEQYVIDNKL